MPILGGDHPVPVRVEPSRLRPLRLPLDRVERRIPRNERVSASELEPVGVTLDDAAKCERGQLRHVVEGSLAANLIAELDADVPQLLLACHVVLQLRK
jgi:hypothetical protein